MKLTIVTLALLAARPRLRGQVGGGAGCRQITVPTASPARSITDPAGPAPAPAPHRALSKLAR